eukprot:Seg709.5 transcript_id=Seg709.5/GoldUCD/mRNA.D3Y31 product="Band 4.1-like protein 1" protein_id=Seg709.5/GoldUCD/D3Y31
MMKRLFNERKYDVVIKLLDGEEFRTEATKSTLGRDVLDQVCEHVGLDEADFFGLKFVSPKDRQLSWIDNVKTLGKQMGPGPYHLVFRVKFYPPNPAVVHEDITRYHIVLQVRDDLLKERLICSVPIHALLSSYLIQAEKGDYDPIEHRQGYLDGLKFMPNQAEDFLGKVAEFHKKHKGFTPAEAEFHYLDNARKIPLYAMDLHDAIDGDGTNVIIGVSEKGIHVILKGREISKFSWSNIHKVYFKSKRFYLDIRVVTETEYDDLTIGFRCRSRTELKRLYRSAIDHHTFFRRDASVIGGQKVAFFKLGSRFRYSGRKTFQQLKTSSHSRAPPTFQRVSSERLSKSTSHAKREMGVEKRAAAKAERHDLKDANDKKLTTDDCGTADDGSPCISRDIVIMPTDETPSIESEETPAEAKPVDNNLAVTITISPPTPIPGGRRSGENGDSPESYEVIESPDIEIEGTGNEREASGTPEGSETQEAPQTTPDAPQTTPDGEVPQDCVEIRLVEKSGVEHTLDGDVSIDKNSSFVTETQVITHSESSGGESITEMKSTTTIITTKTEVITVNETSEEIVVVEEQTTNTTTDTTPDTTSDITTDITTDMA